MSIEIKPHAIRLEDAIGVERKAQARLKAVEYYRAGGVAPYEESYPLGDLKDGRFVSVSLWPMREGNELRSDVRLYLKRKAVHPEAHTMTTTVLVQDDHQTTLLGVNNFCRPGTLAPCLEPIAGRIDPGDSEWATWQHESAEERGVVPGHPFNSLQFLSKGLLGEKVPNLLASRTFVIGAVLTTSDAIFAPSSMQSNKPTPTELGVVQQTHTELEDLAVYHANKSTSTRTLMKADLAQMQAGGMHLSPTPAYFSIKVQQLRRALCHESTEFATGLIHTLDISSIQSTKANAQPHKTAEIERPDSVSVRVDGPHYISDTGIEAIDVNIHYGDGDGGGKTKCHSVLRVPQNKRIAVVPIFPTENGVGHDTLLVKQWCPGYGSGDQPDAWCLGFPSGSCEADESIEQSINRIVGEHTGCKDGKQVNQILSRTGVFDINAGMTNAEMEVVEVLFKDSLGSSNQSPSPDVSLITAPLTPSFRSTLFDLMTNGTRVDHVTSAFATKMFQIDNALKVTPSTCPKRHWSYALPGVMKDTELELDEEARSIEETFRRM